ncbi:hypothetical protein HO173_013161 [Letharia columbiana]|uniref:Uncharacterized protein n=1 Tax=Letharia columbiana TaxID=112416 RepID=A0A8H6CHT2_9LECA|nr:uncharacterized protein HO173_013161 [Letharia columbiana]KAF6223830.1 hypothetical protein HO173_013161 [Letharia columbiana]
MQPAFFEDGQSLASIHYHVDACFWKGNTFIDGATFLVPSKLPEARSQCYSVDLDNTTGVHHVTLRKAALQTGLPLIRLSNANFSSHDVEFSNGEMMTVPKRQTRKTPSKVYEWESSIAQARPVRNIVRQIQFGMFGQDSEADEVEHVHDQTISAPAGSDSSITRVGRVVGQQAADDQSRLSNFAKSIIHVVSGGSTASSSIGAEVSDAAAQAQESIESSVDTQLSDNSSISRRSSAGSQGNGDLTSTVPTSPAWSTLSTLPFWKSALANLPQVPIAPGKPSYATKALALEVQKHDDLGKTDDQEQTVFRRLSWGLRISDRQLLHWDEIQDGESPYLEKFPAPRNDLVMTQEGQIDVAEDVSNNVQSSLTSAPLTSTPVEALPSFCTNEAYISQCFDALDVVRIELVGRTYSRLFPLDLVLEAKGKQHATDAPKIQRFPPVSDELGVEIAIDSASGELYLRPKMSAPSMVVQSISATKGTNVAAGSSVPAQDQPSSDSAWQPHRLEDIDLTAVFNQGATELDDEGVYAEPSTIASHVIGSRLAQTQYIPSEYADHVEYMIQAHPFVPRIVVEANEYWNFIKVSINGTWYAQGCPKGFLPRRSLFENDSDAVFRELLGLGSKPQAVVERPQDLRVGFPVHHFNLIDQPVFQDSRNPSAVSYWAAIASYRKMQIKDGVSWKAVVSSQAAKWVDPCTLDRGVEIPDDLRARQSSRTLRDFVTGQTTIRYLPCGTWIWDEYDSDQEIPEVMSTETREAMLNASSAANTFHGLQRPYFITPYDGDINVNDDGTGQRSLRLKQGREWKTSESRSSTNLRLVDNGTVRVYSFKGMEKPRVSEVLEKYETADILVIDLPFKAEPANALEETPNEAGADEIEDESSEAETELDEELAVDHETVNYVNTSTSLMVIKSPAAEKPDKDMVQAPVEENSQWSLKSVLKQIVREAAEKAAENSDKSNPPDFQTVTHDDVGALRDTRKAHVAPVDSERDQYLAEVLGPNPNASKMVSGQGSVLRTADFIETSESPVPPERLLSKQVQTDLELEVAPPPVHRVANSELAHWSSSPQRIMRGEWNRNTIGEESEEKERDPGLDVDSLAMIPDCAERFNLAYILDGTIVDPEFDEHVAMLLGPGVLAQKFMSGQGVIPFTTSGMMTLLGPGAVGKTMDGYGITRATRGMTFLGTGAVPDIAYAILAESDGATLLFSDSVDNPMPRLGGIPSTTDSTDTRESPILSGRNLSPMKMFSSALDQPKTPPQSPEAVETLGVWEDDGKGGFRSPGKHCPQCMTIDVDSQGDDVSVFDSRTEEAPAAAQTAFYQALVLANARAESTVADRATDFEDEEVSSTPVRSKLVVLSPIQENSRTPIQRIRRPTAPRLPWNPNFMWGSHRTCLPARKQVFSSAERALAEPVSAESSKTHSRNTSFSWEETSTESGYTHTRNTSVSITSSSPEAVSTENGNTHTRNTSLSEARSLEEDFNNERAVWEVVRREGYAASRMAQFDSPVTAAAALGAAAPEDALASPPMQHEAKGHTSHYLLVIAIAVAFLWPFV